MAELEAARELEELIANARATEAPPLGALAARRMVRRALREGERRRLGQRKRARYAALCAAAALLLGLMSYAFLARESATEVAVAAHGLPLRLSLEAGDTLVVAPGARLLLLSEKSAERRIRVRQGSALFEVHKRTKGERFEVETPHALVRVRGTLFSVEVRGAQSVVRVHEGSVWVNERILGAGDVWASPGPRSAAAIAPERALASEVRAALATRAARGAAPAPALRSEPAPSRAPSPLLPAQEAPAKASPKAPARAAPEAQAAPARAELDELRALLRLGQGAEVIARVYERAQSDDAYLLLLADALRAHGKLEEARAHYTTLAGRARGTLRVQAGFAAAQIAFVAQGDARAALEQLDRFALDAPDSALAERASVLRAELLLALGRREEAEQVARTYLAREPDTEASARMRRILSADDAGAP